MNPSSKYPLGSFLTYIWVLLYKALIQFVLNRNFPSFTQETHTYCIVYARHMFLRLPEKNLANLIMTYLEHINSAISRDKDAWSMKHLHLRIMWCQQTPSMGRRDCSRDCVTFLRSLQMHSRVPLGWLAPNSVLCCLTWSLIPTSLFMWRMDREYIVSNTASAEASAWAPGCPAVQPRWIWPSMWLNQGWCELIMSV